MSGEKKTHTFDWHQEAEGSFLKWLLVTLVAEGKGTEREKRDRLFDQLSEATEKFSNVELGITVNGVECDAKVFLERLDQQMDWAVDRAAKRLIFEGLPELAQLQETVHDLDTKLKESIIQAAAKAGLDITEDEWRDR